VLEAPAPVALFLRFGESAIEFVLRFWTGDFETWQVLASEVMIEVHASLAARGSRSRSRSAISTCDRSTRPRRRRSRPAGRDGGPARAGPPDRR